MEFRSKKFPWNRLGTAYVIPRKEMLIPRHSEVYKRVYLESPKGRNCMKKICFTKISAPANRIDSMFLSKDMLRKGIPSCCLFPGMVRKRNPSVCFLFCSMVQNSEHFYPLRNGSERNSENFLFWGAAGIPPEQTNCSVYSVF